MYGDGSLLDLLNIYVYIMYWNSYSVLHQLFLNLKNTTPLKKKKYQVCWQADGQ